MSMSFIILLMLPLGAICHARLFSLTQINGYKMTINKKLFVSEGLNALVCLVAFLCSYFGGLIIGITAQSIAIALLLTKGILEWRKIKAKFKFTKRGGRLLAVYLLLCVANCIVCAFFAKGAWLAHLSVPLLLSPAVFCIVLTLLAPFEKHNSQRYVNKVKSLLSNTEMIKIGITGSAGKTGVKNILTDFLRIKYSVLPTPENYNTPLGIALTLKAYNGERFFVAEMGARKKGDIKELVDLVRPDVGVLTTINPQHQKTFGGADNIYCEKSVLIDEAPLLKVLNIDNPIIARGYVPSPVSIGVSAKLRTRVYAENVECSIDGTSFTLCCDNKKTKISTPLLGKHNVINILLAAAVAMHFGVSANEIGKRAALLQPTPHRLEKTVTKGGVIILDDAYNANVEGVGYALSLIKTYAGRKVICAQGIVEQGKAEKSVNYEIGKKIGEVADVIVTLSRNKKYIIDGAKAVGFDPNKIFAVKDIKEAQSLFRKLLKTGDLLYLQNDIPDII